MTNTLRLLIGSLLGAIATFVVGFIFWASPLRLIAYGSLTDQQAANVQLSLGQNVPHTGRYMVPDPASAPGAALYARGPVATVDVNLHGFAGNDMGAMIGGFIHEWIVALLVGLSLLAVAGRVTDFPSRARLVIGLATASTLLITLSDPIFSHADWRFAIYGFVADLAMIVAGGLTVTWFLPQGSRLR